MPIQVAQTLHLFSPTSIIPEVYMWTGFGDLQYDGQTYRGTQNPNATLFQMSEVDETSQGVLGDRATLRLAMTEYAARHAFLRDLRNITATFNWLGKVDGNAWIRLPFSFKGILSRPRYSDGVLEAEIESAMSDLYNRETSIPLQWSDQRQRHDYPDDRGFEYVAELENGIDIRWPP